jgi:hypothetical protein
VILEDVGFRVAIRASEVIRVGDGLDWFRGASPVPIMVTASEVKVALFVEEK